MHALFDMGTMHIPAANITIAAKRSWVESHRPLVQKYIDAIVQGIQRQKRDKAFTVGVLKTYFKSDDTHAMEFAYDYFTRATPSIPYPKVEQFADIIAEMSKNNEAMKNFDVTKIFDDSFLRDAARRFKLK